MNIGACVAFQNKVENILNVSFSIAKADARELVKRNSEKLCNDWATGWKTPEMCAGSISSGLG